MVPIHWDAQFSLFSSHPPNSVFHVNIDWVPRARRPSGIRKVIKTVVIEVDVTKNDETILLRDDSIKWSLTKGTLCPAQRVVIPEGLSLRIGVINI